MNTPTDDPTDAPDHAREALIARMARRLDELEARLNDQIALLETTIVLSEEQMDILRELQAQPMVYTGSPAVGRAIAFVRKLAARLPARS